MCITRRQYAKYVLVLINDLLRRGTKILYFVNENFPHNAILCIFERDNIFFAPIGYIIMRVSQTKQKETYSTVLYVKKDSQIYFSLMEHSVVNVGKEEQRHRFKSL